MTDNAASAGTPLVSETEIMQMVESVLINDEYIPVWDAHRFMLILRDHYEAALQEARAWQVVEVGFTTRGEGHGGTEFRINSKAGSGKPNVIHVYHSTIAGWAHVGLVMLPDDLRLCRLAKPASDGDGTKEDNDEAANAN